MPTDSHPNPTELLRAWSQGDKSAFDQLIPLVYRELHALANRQMRQERGDHTLQTTALINEAYVRLIDVNQIEWQSRAHFLAIAARTMRRILVDFARRRDRQKRGGDVTQVTLDEALDVGYDRGAHLVSVDDALTALGAFDARMSEVVELRFFGGLTVEETADVLQVSPATVMRDWKTAKAWLVRELSQ